jgi:HlyD family secretion protein
VEVSLPDKLVTTYKKELPYLLNMQGQADIITEDISLLERFILPIKRVLKESLFVVTPPNFPGPDSGS